MRSADAVGYGVGSEIRLVFLGYIGFSVILNYQLKSGKLLEGLLVSLLYLYRTDIKYQIMHKTICQLALSVVVEQSRKK